MEISKIDYYNIMVSFWRHQNSTESSELICLGIFVRSNWIFLTTHCAKELIQLGKNTVIEYGGYATKHTLPEFINMDCIKEVHSLSKFSIVLVSNSTLHGEK